MVKVNDSPRQNPAYGNLNFLGFVPKYILSMKNMMLLLLLLPFILLAQAQEPLTSEPVPQRQEFDIRCVDSLDYGQSLVYSRRNGVPLAYILSEIHTQSTTGNLRQYSSEIISYMIDVVLIVYNEPEVDTADGAFASLRKIETMCLKFIEPEEEPEVDNRLASESIST